MEEVRCLGGVAGLGVKQTRQTLRGRVDSTCNGFDEEVLLATSRIQPAALPPLKQGEAGMGYLRAAG